MERVVAAMVDRRVAACIDLHNNSGRNPYYACIWLARRSSLETGEFIQPAHVVLSASQRRADSGVHAAVSIDYVRMRRNR